MMRTTNPRQARYVMNCLVLAFLLCMTAQGQTKDQNVFRPIPAALRARLVERLQLLIEYQRGQEWEGQYNMLSAIVTQGESKEDHVKRLQHLYAKGHGDLLVDFTPKSVTYQGGGPSDAVIFGCAKLRKNGTVKELYALVEAYREKEDWYFSPVSIIMPVGGKPQPCPYSNTSVTSP